MENNKNKTIQDTVENNTIITEEMKQRHIKNVYEKNKDTGLEKYVEQYKLANPDKYLKAQQIGTFCMDSKYELSLGVDEEGEMLKYRELTNLLENNILEFEDLDENEKELLKKYNKNNL